VFGLHCHTWCQKGSSIRCGTVNILDIRSLTSYLGVILQRLRKLPPPLSAGSSKCQGSHMSFPVDFSTHNVKYIKLPSYHYTTSVITYSLICFKLSTTYFSTFLILHMQVGY
jgi:hypothetical protein